MASQWILYRDRVFNFENWSRKELGQHRVAVRNAFDNYRCIPFCDTGYIGNRGDEFVNNGYAEDYKHMWSGSFSRVEVYAYA